MHGQATDLVEVLVTEPDRLHELLNDAEAALRPVAIVQGFAGILITRHDSGRYTLALSDMVPFGQTREQILS
jgi:hypothetical protein